MEMAGLVQSCFRPLRCINLQVELQPYKMRGFSLCGEDSSFFHGSPKFGWVLDMFGASLGACWDAAVYLNLCLHSVKQKPP